MTTPVADPTVATDGALLLHAPPVALSVNVIVDPIHTDVGPDIATGAALTVTEAVLRQPVESVYAMEEVPADMPVTIPAAGSTEATDGAPLLHDPPIDVSNKLMLEPTHTLPGPNMALGTGFTVMTVVALAVPHERTIE